MHKTKETTINGAKFYLHLVKKLIYFIYQEIEEREKGK